MNQSENSQALLGLTAEVISAHVKNNHVDAADLPLLIERVYSAMRHAGAPTPSTQAPAQPQTAPEPQAPVVSVKKSVFPDYIVCLEDGRKMKTLKRYLRTNYNMTPEQYRDKWDLPPEYPMVAPSYAEHRSALAKQAGLGRKPAAAQATVEVVAAAPVQAPVQAPAPTPLVREPLSETPMREVRSEHTLASVFSNFPRPAEASEDAPEAPGDADDRKPRRKPFSKQLARGMRR